jgi:acetyl-CoA carboxylase biotin carboxylase subunit
LRRAVDEYFIGGIKSNLPLFRRILSDPAFVAGETDTGYLERLSQAGAPGPGGDNEVAAIAAAVFASLGTHNNEGTPQAKPQSGWKRAARTESLQ